MNLTKLQFALFILLQSNNIYAATYTGTFTGLVNDIATYGGPELDGKISYNDVLTGSYSYSTDDAVINYFGDDASGKQTFNYLSGNINFITVEVNGYIFSSSDLFTGLGRGSEMMLYEGTSPGTVGAKNIEINGYGDDFSFDIDPYTGTNPNSGERYPGKGAITLSIENYTDPYPLKDLSALDDPETILLAAALGLNSGGNSGVKVYSFGSKVGVGGFLFSATLTSLNNVTCTPTNFSCEISPVPIPAAFWLFGSALLGLLGFNCREPRIVAKRFSTNL